MKYYKFVPDGFQEAWLEFMKKFYIVSDEQIDESYRPIHDIDNDVNKELLDIFKIGYYTKYKRSIDNYNEIMNNE